ncbi:MAG: hypothetical protein ABT05_00915 [Lautropia sp. SCN 66-9]|nr:MAG: hypothetical protein ABT05_00915 [Lautropia sp. SCN 66-9]
MLMMRPLPRFIRIGAMALLVKNADFTLTAKTRSQSASVLAVNGMPGGLVTPTALTSVSVSGNLASAAPIAS